MGFSLVELITSVAMSSLLFAALYSFYRSQLFAVRTEEAGVNLKQEADVGLDFIVKELRVAGARPAAYPGGCGVPGCGGSGFQRISDARPSRITVHYDYRGNNSNDPPDGCPNDADETITYDLPGTTIQRTANGAAAPLVENVVGFSLQYSDLNGNPIHPGGTLTEAERGNVARVRVTISTAVNRPDPRIGGQLSVTRTSTVFLRNPQC